MFWYFDGKFVEDSFLRFSEKICFGMKIYFFYYDWKIRFCVFCVYYFGRKIRLCNFGGKIFFLFAILIEKFSFAVLVRKFVLRGFCMNFCVVLTEKRNYLVLKVNLIL